MFGLIINPPSQSQRDTYYKSRRRVGRVSLTRVFLLSTINVSDRAEHVYATVKPVTSQVERMRVCEMDVRTTLHGDARRPRRGGPHRLGDASRPRGLGGW